MHSLRTTYRISGSGEGLWKGRNMFLALVLLNFCPSPLFSQLLLNEGVQINLNGGTVSSASVYLTLNNPTGTPIILSGSGTNGIVMETEYSITKYNLGTGTAPITVPYVSSAGEFFPLTLTPTSSGTGNGNIQFSSTKASSRSTGWDNANYMPSDVTNMNGLVTADNSAMVIDRFWIVDAKSYTTSPPVSMIFSYINAEGALNGGNLLTLANLQAQPFDKGASDWNSYPPAGANTLGGTTGTVSGVTLSTGQMGTTYRSWTLVDFTSPLPVELLSYNGNCLNGNIAISWETASETNSSYFKIERSYDGILFQLLGEIPAAGISSSKKTYSYTDKSYEPGTAYYRLTETDLNGRQVFSGILKASCDNSESGESLSLYSFQNQVQMNFNSLSDQALEIRVFDTGGRSVFLSILPARNGTNNYTFPLSVSTGIYFVQIKTATRFYAKHLLIEP